MNQRDMILCVMLFLADFKYILKTDMLNFSTVSL